MMSKIVLQKYIAQSGYCSRRRAEDLIRQGQVSINGLVAELGARVNKDDNIRIGSKKIEWTKNKIYVKLNKPNGYTCTKRKFIGERNVFELLEKEDSTIQQEGSTAPLRSDYGASIKGLHIAGRLDKDSRGLVLLTNDGELTQKLTHPRYGHEKIYVVEIKSLKFNIRNLIKKFRQGVDIGGGDGIIKVKSIKYINGKKFEIILTEGKKRQIRRMFKALGREVADLKRIGIGDLKLGNLKEGNWQYLTNKEIKLLKL